MSNLADVNLLSKYSQRLVSVSVAVEHRPPSLGEEITVAHWRGDDPRFIWWMESMRLIRGFWPAGEIDMDPKWDSSSDIGNVEPIHIPGLNRWARSVGGIHDLGKRLVFPKDFNGSDALHGEGITTDFDRIAWYSTFRNGPKWGIYIRKTGIAGLGVGPRVFAN